jgi:hypothetical protein
VFVVGLPLVFLEASSLEFLAQRFLLTCSREILINEWDVCGTEINEGVHSLGWTGKRKRAGGKSG